MPFMKRIIIIGSPGSGKSTVAKILSAKFNLPLIQLDHLYWLPGRIRRPAEEFYDLMMQGCKQDAWVMDGNSIRHLTERIAYADTIIFLDIPRRTCLWRIIKRAFHSLFTGEEFAPGCPNTLTWEFVSWAWHWEKRYRNEFLRILATVPANKVMMLKNTNQVDTFLAQL